MSTSLETAPTQWGWELMDEYPCLLALRWDDSGTASPSDFPVEQAPVPTMVTGFTLSPQ